MSGPTVALDVTPLVAARTGIGHFVADLTAALGALEHGPTVRPYVLSRRAPVSPDTIRLPLPAGLAVQCWGRLGWPALDARLGDATVVHGTNFVAPPSRRRAVVVTVHDIAFARFPELCSAEAVAAGRVAARLAKRGAWIHTPSAHVAAEVRDLFSSDRVRAIPHGVPRLPPAPANGARSEIGAQAGPFILALGTLEPRKRHAELVAAFGRVASAHPQLRLVVAGADGPARPSIDVAVDALPGEIRNRVVLTGRVDDETRGALLREASVFVYPSLYEGFGLPVLEAMSVGTPVVAARSGGVTECADGAAVLVDGEVGEVAGAIDQVLEDSALRSQLIEAGRRRAQQFDWATTAEAMTELYREAAG